MYYGIAENTDFQLNLLTKYVDTDLLHLIQTAVFDQRLVNYSAQVELGVNNPDEQILPDTTSQLLEILEQNNLVPVAIPEYIATLLQNEVNQGDYYDGSTIGVQTVFLSELNDL